MPDSTRQRTAVASGLVRLSVQVCVLTILLLIPRALTAQVAVDELMLVMQGEPPRDASKRECTEACSVRTTSESLYFMNASLYVYQNWISPQSAEACNFSPSCSQYAKEALQTWPAPRALLMISDRLQRCRGGRDMSRRYRIDMETGRFYDPVPARASTDDEE